MNRLGILMGEIQRATRKLDTDPTAPLSPSETLALEAVIRTDGTRPTLLVRDDGVDVDHPLARDWTATLTATRETMRDRVRAVGRIEPASPTARNYFGTGWVVDAGKGLVLTNLHVLEAIWRRLPHTMVRTATGFRVLDGAFIDFACESGRTRTNRFRVVEATPSGIDGSGFARLDAAVLKIEPTRQDGQEVPAAIRVLADPDGPRGNLGSFCVVGFPGPPPFTAGIHEGVDWTWVSATLFGNRYGVKRLAPGNAHRPLGSLQGDQRGCVFGHDPTTLRGSSGSPILGWLDATPAAFGLHFAGASVDTNCAHAFAACAEALGGSASRSDPPGGRQQSWRIRSSINSAFRGPARTPPACTWCSSRPWSTRLTSTCASGQAPTTSCRSTWPSLPKLIWKEALELLVLHRALRRFCQLGMEDEIPGIREACTAVMDATTTLDAPLIADDVLVLDRAPLRELLAQLAPDHTSARA